MLWEVELVPLGRDGERERVCDEFDLITHSNRGGDWVMRSSRGFLLEGSTLNRADAHKLSTTRRCGFRFRLRLRFRFRHPY